MILSVLTSAWQRYRLFRSERLARAAVLAASADELRRSGALTTLGGSFTLPFGR